MCHWIKCKCCKKLVKEKDYIHESGECAECNKMIQDLNNDKELMVSCLRIIYNPDSLFK